MTYIRKTYNMKYYEVLSTIDLYPSYKISLYEFEGELISDRLDYIKGELMMSDRCMYHITYLEEELKIEIEQL